MRPLHFIRLPLFVLLGGWYSQPSGAGEGGVSFGRGVGVGAGLAIISEAAKKAALQRESERHRSGSRRSDDSDDDSSNDEAAAAVLDAQRALKELGFDPGAIDGQYGSQTRLAVEQYQRSVGAPVTGRLTPTLKKELFEAAAKAKPADAKQPPAGSGGAK